MTKKDKLIERFLSLPKDFTYQELVVLLRHFGYKESNKGKTSGSRVSFIHPDTEALIITHKPHPGNILKTYVVKQIINNLKKEKFI